MLLCFARNRHKLGQRLLIGNNISVQMPAFCCCFPTLTIAKYKFVFSARGAHYTKKKYTLCFAWLTSFVDGVGKAQHLEESCSSQNNWAQFCAEASRALVPAGTTTWSSSAKGSHHVQWPQRTIWRQIMNPNEGEESLPGKLLMNAMQRERLFCVLKDMLMVIAQRYWNTRYRTVLYWLHMGD